MFESKYLVYFFLGGLVVALTTFLAAHGRGWLAGFIAMFPIITVFTFYTVYLEAGIGATVSYVKAIMIFIPAWVCYLLCVLGSIPRFGIGPALVFGVAVYIASAWLISRLLL